MLGFLKPLSLGDLNFPPTGAAGAGMQGGKYRICSTCPQTVKTCSRNSLILNPKRGTLEVEGLRLSGQVLGPKETSRLSSPSLPFSFPCSPANHERSVDECGSLKMMN